MTFQTQYDMDYNVSHLQFWQTLQFRQTYMTIHADYIVICIMTYDDIMAFHDFSEFIMVYLTVYYVTWREILGYE